MGGMVLIGCPAFVLAKKSHVVQWVVEIYGGFFMYIVLGYVQDKRATGTGLWTVACSNTLYNKGGEAIYRPQGKGILHDTYSAPILYAKLRSYFEYSVKDLNWQYAVVDVDEIKALTGLTEEKLGEKEYLELPRSCWTKTFHLCDLNKHGFIDNTNQDDMGAGI